MLVLETVTYISQFTSSSNLILAQKIDDLDKNKSLLKKIGHINCFTFTYEATLILCLSFIPILNMPVGFFFFFFKGILNVLTTKTLFQTLNIVRCHDNNLLVKIKRHANYKNSSILRFAASSTLVLLNHFILFLLFILQMQNG
jgi:hypothetical protein